MAIWLIVGVMAALQAVASCAPADQPAQSTETALVDFGKLQRKGSFCKNQWEQCQVSDSIVSKALQQADNYFPDHEDPSDIDGKRDAFRHVVSMIWITLSYGNIFARNLSDATDPDPKSYREPNPQVVCERNMDRINNLYGINVATRFAKICGIPTNRRATKKDWDDYDNQGAWNCIALEAAQAIRQSRSSTTGPVVIARQPRNATKCWIVPSSTEIGSHGRPSGSQYEQ